MPGREQKERRQEHTWCVQATAKYTCVAEIEQEGDHTLTYRADHRVRNITFKYNLLICF